MGGSFGRGLAAEGSVDCRVALCKASRTAQSLHTGDVPRKAVSFYTLLLMLCEIPGTITTPAPVRCPGRLEQTLIHDK